MESFAEACRARLHIAAKWAEMELNREDEETDFTVGGVTTHQLAQREDITPWAVMALSF